MPVTDQQIAWLAGLFEGEGTIVHKQGCVALSITMSDRDVLERVDRLFPSPNGLRTRHPRDPKHKITYAWTVQRGDVVRAVLAAIMPYLGARRMARAQEALAYLNQLPGRRPNSRKTHCKEGHALSGPNLYRTPSGRRQYKTCRRAAGLRYQEKASCQ